MPKEPYNMKNNVTSINSDDISDSDDSNIATDSVGTSAPPGYFDDIEVKNASHVHFGHVNNEADTSSGSDESDDDSDDDDDSNIAVDSVANVPPPSYFGNIVVKNSSHVHFGNTAVYNGPVTVQQIVNSAPSGESDSTTQDVLKTDSTILPVTFPSDKTIPNDFSDKDSRQLSQQFSIVLTKPEDDISHGILKPRRWCLLMSGGCIFITVVLIVVLVVVLAIVLAASKSPVDSDDTNWDFYYNNNQTLLNGTEGIAPFYTRADWLAQPVGRGDKFKEPPVPFVIISHSATAQCFNRSQCVFQVRAIQTYHIESFGWRDIGYNFLVGGDGGAYEGRGWDLAGAHAYGYNNRSIGICTIGTFIEEVPPIRQTRALKLLIEEGVRLGKISPQYKLLAHRQVSSTESPGLAYYKELQKWPHWVPEPNSTLPQT